MRGNDQFTKKEIIIFLIYSVVIVPAIVLTILFVTRKAEIPNFFGKDNIKIQVDKQQKIYEENKMINPDYVGQIYFESNLIDLPFVQGSTNDQYMRTDWTTGKYDEGGSIFMEASNDIDKDQNIIIYGHNFDSSLDPTNSKMFSPLRVLREKSNYKDNRIIYLYLGNEIRKYEIVYVYKVKVLEDGNVQYLDEGEPFYDTTNFTRQEFDDYIKKVKDRVYYDTSKSISYSDKMLTLQTCIDYDVDKFIIIAKLIENTPIK